MSARILVVEDDPSLRMVLQDALEREGHKVQCEENGRTGHARASSGRYDLVVLDLMLPGMDGYEICRRLKDEGVATPILMLTARGRAEDKVKGLDLGADDYLTKPFALEELLARVRARLRANAPQAPRRAQIGEALVDFGAMTVVREAETLPLTRLEAGVLELLLARQGTVVTRSDFLDEVWGYDRHPTTRTVDMHVARVREKLGDNGASPAFIHTVHGVGYRFDPPAGTFAPLSAP